jgi:hypothetical protein
MSTNHTPGPLSSAPQKGTPGNCWQAQIFNAGGMSIASMDSTQDPAIASDRARRLAACWNACERMGISTETLESGPDSVFIFAGDMKAQRDHFLALCKEWVAAWDKEEFEPSIASRMRAAIAKATGGAA